MEKADHSVTIDDLGIASVLTRWQLVVPLNQRRYEWDEEYVDQLFHDLSKAFEGSKPIYFLGTIVLTEGPKGTKEVADGQQRLATTSILIAAIRDYLLELGDQPGANEYQSDYLIKYDPPSGQYRARLSLNVEDDQFFHSTILLPPDKRPSGEAKKFRSNDRIQSAAVRAREHVRSITATRPTKDKAERLYEWIEFLRDSALVVAITVPSHISDSFRMFETLNARGLRASQVDILKNFLFGKAPDSISQIHPRWISMLSTIESYGGDDLLLTFIRHFWISQQGPTTQNALGENIESKITKEQQAIDMVASLDSAAEDYVALLAPMQHPRWSDFPSSTRKTIDILTNQLESVQIRPLMLAVTRCFNKKETQKAFEMFVSWSVRFLIVGGGGGGKLDRYYGTRARDVTNGKIMSAKELAANMADVVPQNRQFQEAFSQANVRTSSLARYYLRALELHGKEDHPQLLINEDPDVVNLEHVMPINPSDDWEIDAETATTFHKRLGNMVLFSTSQNTVLGNGSFALKKTALSASPFTTTQEVGKCENWGTDEIKERQGRMADVAPKVWPL